MLGTWAMVFVGVGLAIVVIYLLSSFEDWFNDKTEGD